MPNYVGNTVTIDGPSHILADLVDHQFDFNWIHPVPSDAEANWARQHWTTIGPHDQSTFTVEHFSDDKTHLEVWFRTVWSTPYALFAYLSKKYPEINMSVRYTSGDAIDYVGNATYTKGNVQDIRIYPDRESPKALAQFSQENSWFDYQQWKQMRIELGFTNLENVDDISDPSVKPEHLEISEGTYESIVGIYNDLVGNWQDKCISSNNQTNYS